MDQEHSAKLFQISNAPWKINTQFRNEQGCKVIQEHLIPLLNKVLEFLRTEAPSNIKNSEVSEVYQILHTEKLDNTKEFLDFYQECVHHFCQEMSDAVSYTEDEEYAENVGKRWVNIKQFIFWIGFFFKFCVEISEIHLLYGSAFNDNVKSLFFEQHKTNLKKCIYNLIDKERLYKKEHNQNIQYLIQMFLVCGMENLQVKKSQEKNIKDPIQYISGKDEVQKSNKFYIDMFEKEYKKHLVSIYNDFHTSWWQQNNTQEYISKSMQYLSEEDELLDRYIPFSKRVLLDAIEDIVIVQPAKDLCYSTNTGFQKMIINKKYDQILQIYTLLKRVPKTTIDNHNKKVERMKEKIKLDEEEQKKQEEKAEKRRQKQLQKEQKLQEQQQQTADNGDEQKVKEEQKIEEEITEQKDIQQQQQQQKPETKIPDLKVHPITHLQKIFYEHIKEEGLKINQNQEINTKPVEYYTAVIELKQEADKILEVYLKKDMDMTRARDDGFCIFLNKFEDAGQFLAQFCDHFLHKDSSKQITQDQKEAMIKMVDSFVYFISQKDVFFQWYEKYLAARLLGNKVDNTDNENQVIACFKKEHGAQSMKNCSKMMQDIENAEQENKEFYKFLETKSIVLPDKLDFKTTILQQACWPINTEGDKKENDVVLPRFLLDCTLSFENYYLSVNKSKKISWLLKEGEANVQMLTGSKCTFTGSTFHMLFLLAFNEKDDWKIKEIKDFLNFTPQRISQFVKQFLKYKLIKVDPPLQKKEDKLTADHTIKLQVNFKSEKRRIHLNIVKRVEERQVEKITTSSIDMNRGIILEANIVRIMKGKRTLNFADLQGEVIKITKLFKPEIKMIKQKIEGLIEKEFLERDPQNPTILIYKP